jgi:hypothetical protein
MAHKKWCAKNKQTNIMLMIHCSFVHQKKNGDCSHNKMFPFVSQAELVIIPMGHTHLQK